MALTFIKRSMIPESRGKEGTVSVGISGNGQIVLSKKAGAFFGEDKTCVMAFDAGKVYLFRPTAKQALKSEAKDHIRWNRGKKSKSLSFSAGKVLRDEESFGTYLYDFKASGNQSFPAELDEKSGAVTFIIPAGSLAKRPITHRAKKVVAPAVKATPDSTTGKAVSEEELVLS